MGTSDSLGVKRPGREADHSPPSSAEVKSVWSYDSIPSIHFQLNDVLLSWECVFMVWYLVKHRDNFTFTLEADRWSYECEVVPVLKTKYHAMKLWGVEV